MLNILIRAGSYIAIIIMGFVLRRIGFFKESDFSVLSKIVVRITLPAALIVNAATRELDPQLLLLTLFGFFGSMFYVFVGWLLGKRRGKEAQAFNIVNISGYNVGVFVIPFTQTFLGPTGVMAASIFDVGNAFFSLGGSCGIAAAIRTGNGFDFKRVLKALSVSVPFLVHIITFSMNLLHIPFPGPLVECAGIISSANTFLAMLMIGVGFHLSLSRSQIGQILRILLVRFGLAVPLALCYWYLLPFDRIVRLTMVILTAAPLAAAVPGFTEEIGGDVGMSCTICSLMMVISTVTIVTLLLFLL